jgi:preprotein translocase subunit SecD
MRLSVAVALALMPAAIAAQPISRVFTIGGEAFSEGDILDARALPSLDGMPTILISFSPAAGARIATLTGAKVGKPVPILLDGKTVAEPIIREAITGNALELSGSFTMPEAMALAKRISGKEPVPESLDE